MANLPFHDIIRAYGRSLEHKQRILLNVLLGSGSPYYGCARSVIKQLPNTKLTLSAALKAADCIEEEQKREDNKSVISKCYKHHFGKEVKPASPPALQLLLHFSPIRVSMNPLTAVIESDCVLSTDYYLRRLSPLHPGSAAFSLFLMNLAAKRSGHANLRFSVYEAHKSRLFDSRHLALQYDIEMHRELAEIELAAMKAYEVYKSSNWDRRPRREKQSHIGQTTFPFVNI